MSKMGSSTSKVITSEAADLDIEQLYREHAPFVARVLWQLAGPGAHVDDLLQETFIVAFRKRHQFEGRASARTWLYSIALRLCMRHRRDSKRFYLFRKRLAREPLDTVHLPDADLERKRRRDLVHEVLAKMPHKMRRVFVLYELEELEGGEIAEVLGIPHGTVWTRLHHARKRFRRLMAKHLKREKR